MQTWIDWAIALFIFSQVWSGFRRGMIREVAYLGGLIVALLVAFPGSVRIQPLVQDLLRVSPRVAGVIGFIVCFGAVSFLFHRLILSFGHLVRFSFLGWLNQLGGLLVGLCKGALLASLILFILARAPVPEQVNHALGQSQLATKIRPLAPTVYRWVKLEGWPQAQLLYQKWGQLTQ